VTEIKWHLKETWKVLTSEEFKQQMGQTLVFLFLFGTILWAMSLAGLCLFVSYRDPELTQMQVILVVLNAMVNR